jgi:hypothetical protein
MPFTAPKVKGDWAFTAPADISIAANRIVRIICIKISFLFEKSCTRAIYKIDTKSYKMGTL